MSCPRNRGVRIQFRFAENMQSDSKVLPNVFRAVIRDVRSHGVLGCKNL